MGRRRKTDQELLNNPMATSERRGERTKRVRNMANLTRHAMCKSSGININSLKGWEIGRYGGLTRHGAEKIVARVYQEGVNCRFEWLMYGIGTGPVAQIGYDDAPVARTKTITTVTNTRTEEEKIAEELLLFREHYQQNTVDFIIEDDSMLPHYARGDYVSGVKLPAKKISQAIGLDCIVETENGRVFMRRIMKATENGCYTLACSNLHSTEINEPVIYNVKLIYAAPIILHRKKNKMI